MGATFQTEIELFSLTKLHKNILPLLNLLNQEKIDAYGGGTPKLCQNSLQIRFRGSQSKKFWKKILCLQLNNFTQKLDFDVLWFTKSRQHLGRKKNLEEKGKRRTKKEKEKNLIATKSGLVGIKWWAILRHITV